MKNKTIIYISIIAITAISCSSNDKIEQPVNMERVSNESTIIPVDEAIKTLNNFLADTKMIETKSGSQRNIVSIDTHYNVNRTDATGNPLPDAYLVNFEDGSGFAILGANTSVEPVIAVIENGNTTWSRILESTDNTYSEFESDCPDPGIKPEIILGACISNALRDNPMRAVSTKTITGPYDKEILPITDYLDFTQQVTYCHKKNRDYVTCGCAATAISIIAAYTNSTRFMVDYELLNLSKCNTYDGVGAYYIAKGSPVFVQYTDYFTNYSAIPTTLTIDQRIDLLEKVGPGIKKNHSPISVISPAQSFTRTRYKLISAVFYKLNNIIEAWDNTGTLPGAVTNVLKEFGYENVKSTSAKQITHPMLATIESMLDNKKPVLMCGWGLWNLDESHYWVIDGLRYKDNTVYFHCNWGWGGKSNGWFSWLCIDADRPVAMDCTTKSNSTQSNYSNFVLFSYDLPTTPKQIDVHLLYDRRQKYE